MGHELTFQKEILESRDVWHVGLDVCHHVNGSKICGLKFAAIIERRARATGAHKVSRAQSRTPSNQAMGFLEKGTLGHYRSAVSVGISDLINAVFL